MAYFAKVLNGTVTQVIIADQNFFDEFTDSSPGNWIETSPNTRAGVIYNEDGVTPAADQSQALRKNTASKGCTYNTQLDAFIPPKPFESWILNETTCMWEAPVAMPSEGGFWFWNETEQRWDLESAPE
jgi:hypothetical protein